MKTVAVLPTWLLTMAIIPWLPDTHPWHGRRFSLADWSRGATVLTVQFGMVFWTSAICIAVMLCRG